MAVEEIKKMLYDVVERDLFIVIAVVSISKLGKFGVKSRIH